MTLPDNQAVPTAKNNMPMKEDLVGRVRNWTLAPTPENALMPVYEAVMNSIHAIQDSLGEGAATQGKVHVTIHRLPNLEGPAGFTVDDNGVGLTDENFKSFQTCDSMFKKNRGGRGVGRLSWLKVFRSTMLESTFRNGSTTYSKRTFTFVLDNETAIREHSIEAARSAESGTTVRLHGFDGLYQSKCPKGGDAIANRLTKHFLSYLVTQNCPAIHIQDDIDGTIIDLNDRFSKAVKQQQPSTFTIPDLEGVEFSVQHMLIDRSAVQDRANYIFYGANNRVVKEQKIDGQIGLNVIDDQFHYAAFVQSKFLDERSNQERTNFDIESSLLQEIEAAARDSAKKFLEPYIRGVKEDQKKIVEKLLEEEPQFWHVAKDPDAFVEKNLKLNAQNDEEIFLEMSRHGFRRDRNLKKSIREITSAEDENIIKDKIAEVMKEVTYREQAALAQYVAKRKVVIELLEKRQEFQDADKQNKYLEDAVHRLVCPLQATSDDLPFEAHNLWLIDDRLPYYTYLASDEPIGNFTDNDSSKKEPDIVIFNRPLLYTRRDTNDPAVIIEFKQPGRTAYSGDNPVERMIEYIEHLRNRKVVDKTGKTITSITENTPFICYVIADPVPQLVKHFKSAQIANTTPDGLGYYGYHQEAKALIEMIPYDKLIKDANLRNRAFFELLGLNTRAF